MVNFILVSFLISIFCIGLSIISEYGKLLFPIRKLIQESKLSTYIKKPLLLCVYCMPSFWGTLIYFTCSFVFDKNISWLHIALWPFVVISSVSFIGIIASSIDLIKINIDKIQDQIDITQTTYKGSVNFTRNLKK